MNMKRILSALLGAALMAGTSGWDSVLQDAQKVGISTVYQEITLCPNLTVAAMICLFLVVQSMVLSRKNVKKRKLPPLLKGGFR